MTFSNRTYIDANDLQTMCELVIAVRPPARLTDYPSIADLHEAMLQPEICASTRLWNDPTGALVAFAFVNGNNLNFEMLPSAWAIPELGNDIVAHAVSYLLHTAQPPDTLDASCRAEDTPRIALLENNGFTRDALQSIDMERSLSESMPEPHLPDGFYIRPLDSEGEIDAVVALHRAAFGTQYMTVEERRTWMSAPDYDPKLDLVLVAPDGRLAGYCYCQFSRAENELSGQAVGYTDPVAVHPGFQNRGMAHALLLAGMSLLKEHGLQVVRLGTSSENLAMQKAAQAAGFQETSRRAWFMRPLQPHTAH